MTEIPMSLAREQLLAILREAFEGPQQRWSYFLDQGPTGYVGALESVGASEASSRLGPGGSTLAGHVHHMVFALSASGAWLRGDRSPRDWNASWSVEAVDEVQWAELRERLKREYEAFVGVLETAGLSSPESFGGAAAAVVHAAYHLGAIRQRLVRAAAG